MSDKDISLARPMHEKKACCEKYNFLRLIDVKSTVIISTLLLLWTMAFVVLIRHVFASYDNTVQVADAVIHITNETSRLAEERWKWEGGPGPEDRWRQEQEAKRREEERQRIIFAHLIRDKFPVPDAFSNPAVRSSHNRLGIDRTVAKQNTADVERLEGIFDWEDDKVDFSIQRGIENLADQYAIESDTVKTYLLRMVKLYNVVDATIGFAGIWLVLSLGGLIICELIRWFFLGFFNYVAKHIV